MRFNWHCIPEHYTGYHDYNSKNQSYQYLIVDDILLIVEIIFPCNNGTHHTRTFIERNHGLDGYFILWRNEKLSSTQESMCSSIMM